MWADLRHENDRSSLTGGACSSELSLGLGEGIVAHALGFLGDPDFALLFGDLGSKAAVLQGEDGGLCVESSPAGTLSGSRSPILSQTSKIRTMIPQRRVNKRLLVSERRPGREVDRGLSIIAVNRERSRLEVSRDCIRSPTGLRMAMTMR